MLTLKFTQLTTLLLVSALTLISSCSEEAKQQAVEKADSAKQVTQETIEQLESELKELSTLDKFEAWKEEQAAKFETFKQEAEQITDNLTEKAASVNHSVESHLESTTMNFDEWKAAQEARLAEMKAKLLGSEQGHEPSE